MPAGKHKVLLLEDDPVRALIFESVVKRGVGDMMTCPDVATALRHLDTSKNLVISAMI
jgi:hypothetical protein